MVFLLETHISGAVVDSTIREDVPWLFGGDFNAILRCQERIEGSSCISGVSNLFQDFVFDSKLIEVEYVGVDFTWCGGSLYQRLDRCLMNEAWSRKFSKTRVFHLDRLGSDHCPLLLRSTLEIMSGIDQPFRYMAAWKDHDGFVELLASVLVARLSEIQKALQQRHSVSLIKLDRRLKVELDKVLEHEERLWFQKARTGEYKVFLHIHACSKTCQYDSWIMSGEWGVVYRPGNFVAHGG
ncbi:hypothetical protein V6N11_071735 [Hibiscus sabdariffa]|uniref:Endonuclease/exonuclease/phosphatase domain-containing protein n=1 Tax=Hibiscus sabdariffa TaxID=183260 RepID=A0ABR2U111_9ROSI